MKKDILVVAQYTQAPGEYENDRFKYLCYMLGEEKVNTEVVTMDFSHHYKRRRVISNEDLCNLPYKMTFLHVKGYKKNISFDRLYSNIMMAKNLAKYLRQRNKPDLVYCAVPSVIVSYCAAKYCKKKKIKFIIDVQDIWPEAFYMSLNIPFISKMIFYPIKVLADKVYSSADAIIAVSKTYLERALLCNKKHPKTLCVFLGTDLDAIKNYKLSEDISMEEGVKLCYCGTLGKSYDLTCVLDALELIKNKGMIPPKFIVMGNGPDLEKLKTIAEKKELNVEFFGRVPYDKMCGILKECDIAVNPIIHGASQSIINKHADYVGCGLPVINTQESEEYKELVIKYQMGFNCNNNDAEDLAEKIMGLANNPQLRKTMGENAYRCANELFDRRQTYHQIIDLIME